MDLICPVCGEPWDTDSVYHENDRPDLTPQAAARLFSTKGCGALFGTTCTPANSRRTAGADAIYEMLGDDLDGAAAMLDDFEYLGLL